MDAWFLSFDCATKTLAFSLVQARVLSYLRDRDALYERAERGLSEDLLWLNEKTKSYLRVVDSDVIDLFPGLPSKKINVVDRLRAVKKFVGRRVVQSLGIHAPHTLQTNSDFGCSFGADLYVLIENQMGINAAAKSVADALLTLFADGKVFLVNPSWKNKVSLLESGAHNIFLQKFKRSYTANKVHALYNFMHIEKKIDCFVPGRLSTTPDSKKINYKAEKGHIADTFMQVLGFINFYLAKS